MNNFELLKNKLEEFRFEQNEENIETEFCITEFRSM